MKNIFLSILALFLTGIFYGQTLNWAEANYGSYDVGGNFVYALRNNAIDQLDLSGNLIQTFSLNSTVTDIEVITANASDEFAIAGHFVTTEDFDLTGSNPHVVNINNRDYFYAKYSSNGVLQFINTLDDGTTTTNSNIHTTDIRLEDNGVLYLLGNCIGSVDFNQDGVTTSHSFTTDDQDAFVVAQGGGISIRDVIVTPMFQEGSAICVNENDGGIGVAVYSPYTSMMSFGATATVGGVPYTVQYNCTSTFLFSLDFGGAMISAYEMCPNFDYVERVEDMEFGPDNMMYICGVSISNGVITYATGMMDTIMNNGQEDAAFAVVGLNGDTYVPFAGEGMYYVNTYGSLNYEMFTDLEILNNEVYLMGGFIDVVDFDNGPNVENNLIYGDGDIVLYKMVFDPLNFTETFSSIMTIGGTGNDFQNNWNAPYELLYVDGNGDFYMSVIGLNGIDLDPSPVTNNFPPGGYLTKYNGTTSVISGNVYMDNNGNGVKDGGEQNIANVPVEIDNGSYSFFLTTDSLGNYFTNISIGSYTATPAYNTFYSASLPVNYNVNITTPNTTYGGNDFGLAPIGNIDDLIIQINPLTPVRPGFIATYEVFYRNNGNTTQTGTVNFVMDSNFTFVSSTVTPTAVAAPYISWDFFNMAPGTNISMIVDVQVPANIGINVLTYCYGDAFSDSIDIEPLDNTYDLYQITQGSYDPNDKQVFPSSVSQAFVDNEEYLNYLIRFQNTGTDTAFTVIVRDTLDVNLQEQTLEIMSASHTLIPTMYFDAVSGKQIMEFKFENILLPDSNVNEAASHGYLSYRVKLDTSFTTGSVATNTADIYFDFNSPVITNTTITKINELVVAETWTDAMCNGSCDGSIFLNVSGGLAPYYYAWSNANGVTSNNTNLCAGEYHVQVWDSIGNVGTYTYQVADPAVVGFTSTITDASSSIANDGEINISPTGGTAPYVLTVNGGSSQINYYSGMYNVCVTDANDCSICDSVEVGINTGLNESSLLGNIIVAPNPATAFINIIYNENHEINVSLLNNMGQVISTQTITSNYQVDVSSLSQGIYFVKLETESEVVIKRIQVLK